MSFINDIAFDERVDELEVEGHLRVGGDILLHGEFPKMDQQIAALNSSISLKANQSDLDVAVVTLNMKADHEEVIASLSLKADQSELDSALSSVDSRIDGVDGLLGTKANQSALDTLETRASVLEDDLTSSAIYGIIFHNFLSDCFTSSAFTGRPRFHYQIIREALLMRCFLAVNEVFVVVTNMLSVRSTPLRCISVAPAPSFYSLRVNY